MIALCGEIRSILFGVSMSSKSVDKIAYLTNILTKAAQDPMLNLEQEMDFGSELERSIPVEEDFNVGKTDDLNMNIRDFVGDLVESGIPIEAIKAEFIDAMKRYETEGKWEGDELTASKKVKNLLKLANSLKKK